MPTLDEALRMIGLSYFTSKKDVKDKANELVLKVHPDKQLDKNQKLPSIDEALEARKVVLQHSTYRKEDSRDAYSSPYVPHDDATTSIFQIIKEAYQYNSHRGRPTIETLKVSGKFKEAINMRDKNNNTPLHVAGQCLAFKTRSNDTVFFELYQSAKNNECLEFDFTSLNDKNKSIADIVEDVAKNGYSYPHQSDVKDTVSKAMLDKGIRLIEELINTSSQLPTGLNTIKEKFNDAEFKALDAKGKLHLYQTILKNRNAFYDGYLGGMVGFFTHRSPTIPALYNAIIQFDPSQTASILKLQETITGASSIVGRPKQLEIESQKIDAIEDNPDSTFKP